jgi:NDP-sugar pyrophosphorylase family protein
MRVGNDSVIYIGKDCYTNRTSHLYATERKNIIIGNQLLLSFDTYFRTADPHIICDCKTKERINFSKSILIGDKVWIGQQSLILKGTVIGSGAIIGGHSVVSNKTIKSNSLYAGNPAKKIKEGVFYVSPKSTHDLDEEEEMNTKIYTGEEDYTYENDENTISLKQLDSELMKINNASEKVKYLEYKIVNNNSKNRFYQD